MADRGVTGHRIRNARASRVPPVRGYPDHRKRSAMLAPVNYAQLLFPDFSLILCGYLVCRYTALDRGVWEPVEGLVYYFLFPVLLFQSIVRNPLDLAATSGLIGAGLLMGIAGIALAYSVPFWPWIGRHVDK